MYIFLWIFLSVHVSGKSFAIDKITGEFITDVTASIHSAASFTAFLCIDTDNAVEFTQQMSQNNVLHDIETSFGNYEFTGFDMRVAHQHFYVVDFGCPEAVGLLVKANMSRMFVAPAKWLILENVRSTNFGELQLQNHSEYIPSLNNLFAEFDVFPDSEVFVGQREEKNKTIKLLTLYRPSPCRDLVVEDRGSWNNEDGFHFENHHPSSRRRSNLQGTPLKSCLVMTNPDTLNHLTDYKDKLVDAVTKVNYPWILHLVNRINATVDFTVRDTWGYQDGNGSWSGMIGLLDRGEIDIGGTATFLIPQRIGVVDYVQLYTPTGSKFLFRRPPLSYVSNLFTLPFSRSVWIVIVIFLSLVCGLLYLTMKWEYKKYKERKSFRLSAKIGTNPTLSDNLLVILGAVSQQGSSYEPRTISTRIVVLMLLFAALSLYAAYTANIVALLQSTSDSIKTLTDLMNSPLKIGIYDIVYARHILSTLDDPVRKEFYDKSVKDKPHVWISLKEGIDNVRQGLFAFHVEVGAGYQLMQETFSEDEKCGIHEIDIFNLLNPLLVIKRQSPYRELIRVGAMWIHETGLQKRDIRRLYTEKPTCVGQTSFVSVGITECYAAMLTISYGIAITFGIFLIEVIWKKFSSESDKNEVEPEEMGFQSASEETTPDAELDSIE